MYYYNHQLLTKHAAQGCCVAYNSSTGFKQFEVYFRENIFIRIYLNKYSKGTTNHLNPSYSNSVNSHAYSKSAQCSIGCPDSLCHFSALWVFIVWLKMNSFFQRSSLPHAAQITNPTNMAKHQCFFVPPLSFLDADTVIRDLFTAPVLWNRLRLNKMLLYDPNNPFLQSMKRYCFFVLPLLRCLSLFFFFIFLCYAWTAFKQEQDNVGEWSTRMAPHCSIHGTHETILWNEFTHLSKGVTQWPYLSCKNKRERETRGSKQLRWSLSFGK